MALIDIDHARADTPACERMVHFNNASSSPQPEPVTRGVLDHLALEQQIGGYEAEARGRRPGFVLQRLQPRDFHAAGE